MNNGIVILAGMLVLSAFSWWGSVLLPQKQVGAQQPEMVEAIGGYYPTKRPGEARAGAEVYRSLGCAQCHTQQVRPSDVGAAEGRGWGVRRTVARDYLYDSPALLGDQRVGPDLANIGARIRSDESMSMEDKVDWHLRHLYQPRSTTPESRMPAYPFLFEKRRVREGRPSPKALNLTGNYRPMPGFEIVAKPEAEALVAYLLSLRADVPVFEAPVKP